MKPKLNKFLKYSIFALVLNTSVFAENPVNSLKSYWGFNDGKGTTTKELIGKTNDKVNYIFNNARFKDNIDPEWKKIGITNGSLMFDGYSTWIEKPAKEAPVLDKDFTIGVWVAPRAYEWGDHSKFSCIISQIDEKSKKGLTFGIGRHGSWGIEMGSGDQIIKIMAGNSYLPRNEWSYLSVVYKKDAKELKMYLNGDQIAAATIPNSFNFKQSDNTFYIGRHNSPARVAGSFMTNMYNGLMDELMIFDKELTSSELKALYKGFVSKAGGKIPTLSDKDMEWDLTRIADDRNRPQFHATAPYAWMNEPHAPIYYEGKYHLFYQFNPFGPFWHQIHWGHWVSDDMVHWENMPVALYPEKGELAPDGIWSGSAAYDKNGVPALFFTAGNDSEKPNQKVGLAVPVNPKDKNLKEWKMYPKGINTQKDGVGIFGQFRDPFVWRDKENGKWYQLVTSGIPGKGGTALVYVSDDMINWDYKGPLYLSDYNKYPQLGQQWELPVLLPIKDKVTGEEKYFFCINPNGAGANVEINYWIGKWDKENFKFIPDNDEPQLMNVGGNHFIGPSGFQDPKSGRTILFSLVEGERTPNIDYDSGYSAHNTGLPLNLWLENGNLKFEPLKEIETLRKNELISFENKTAVEANKLLKSISGDTLQIEIEIENKTAKQYGIKLRKSPDNQEETVLYYDINQKGLFVNREKSTIDIDQRTSGIQGGKFDLNNQNLKLNIFLDRSVIEAFANKSKALTTRTFPFRDDSKGLEIFADGEIIIKSMKVWEMGSAYGEVIPAAKNKYDAKTTFSSDLKNHDFSEGNLNGWEVIEGNAFSDKSITDISQFWGTINFNSSGKIPGKYHYSGYSGLAGDKATGEMKTKNFVLGGDGKINFLCSGGYDIDNIYVALVRASDNKELLKISGVDYEEYQRIFWDASAYIGQELYIKVVDKATGGWGHINVDDFNVPVAK